MAGARRNFDDPEDFLSEDARHLYRKNLTVPSRFKPVDPNPSPQQKAAYVQRITNVYADAPPEMVRQASSWYPKAHDIAGEIGRGDTRRGAGMMSALSPATNWALNIAQARQMHTLSESQFQALAKAHGIEDRAERAQTVPAVREEHLGNSPLNSQSTENILKAHRIMRGEAPEDVLPMAFKTGHFYRNILDPSDPSAVTVDTHGHDVAYGQKLPYGKVNRGLGHQGRYDMFADAYQRAGRRLGAVPNAVQAVTWSRWRDRHGTPPEDF